jgi:antitoxin CcdA
MGAESYLTLSCDTLEVARRLKINLSQVCDDYLRQLVREEQERRWRQESAAFVAAYNHTLEAEGLPLAEWRTF